MSMRNTPLDSTPLHSTPLDTSKMTNPDPNPNPNPNSNPRMNELLDGLNLDDENALPDEEDLAYLAGRRVGFEDEEGNWVEGSPNGGGGGGAGGLAALPQAPVPPPAALGAPMPEPADKKYSFM